VLKPGGRLIFIDHNKFSLDVLVGNMEGVRNYFSKDDVERMLKKFTLR
jgi:hypothetical protein